MHDVIIDVINHPNSIQLISDMLVGRLAFGGGKIKKTGNSNGINYGNDSNNGNDINKNNDDDNDVACSVCPHRPCRGWHIGVVSATPDEQEMPIPLQQWVPMVTISLTMNWRTFV